MAMRCGDDVESLMRPANAMALLASSGDSLRGCFATAEQPLQRGAQIARLNRVILTERVEDRIEPLGRSGGQIDEQQLLPGHNAESGVTFERFDSHVIAQSPSDVDGFFQKFDRVHRGSLPAQSRRIHRIGERQSQANRPRAKAELYSLAVQFSSRVRR